MSTIIAEHAGARIDGIIGWQSRQIVDRYARSFGRSDEESQACFEAWKQFMAVSAVRGDGNSVPSGPIDEMWHTAVVFTRTYREFCDEYVGRFVDHNPQEHSNPAGYDAARETAEELFGELDLRFWTAEAAECGSGCCND